MQPQNYSPTGGMPPVSSQSPQAMPYPPLALAQKPGKQVGQTILIIAAFLIAAIAIGLLVYVYMQWQDAQLNVDDKIDEAVAIAKAEQRTISDENYAEQAKKPLLEFTGPDDYGRLSFQYPRTWSIYVAKDASRGGDYEAYFNPRVIPPINATNPPNRFALHVTIYDRQYTDVLKTFDSLINANPPKLTSSVFQVGDNTGTRLDGAFSKDIIGTAVLLKINDKTVRIQTDTEDTRGDFDALIQTIRFN